MKYLNYKVIIITVLVVFVGCNTPVKQEDLQKINGYWEIELVESATKKIKKYGLNTTIDYFNVDKNGNGFRIKTKPDFSGKYKTNKVKDTLHIVFKNKQFVLQTRTPYDSWEETIIKLTDDKLILKNDRGILFHYKKHLKYNFK